jgi:hypothetical protein
MDFRILHKKWIVVKRTHFRFVFLVTVFLTTSVFSYGQFYNGMQMSFGKSRVQYNNFYWQYYRFDKFDTYFNQFGKELALYTEWYANQEIKRLETLLDYTLEKRIIFLVYNKLTDFRQSNIGLLNGNEDYNTGGVTRITNNKVSLYFEGDHKKFQQQISASIAEVMLNEMLYGNDLRENMANSTLINLPPWFTKGLLSYLSNSWSVEIEDRVKDGILSGKYKKFNRLTGDDAMYAGHSFWRYIEKTYGRSVIPNIIYITRINKNTKNGFLYVVGSSIKDLSVEWANFYKDKFKSFNGKVEDPGTQLLKRPRKTRTYQNIKLSPDGAHISYVTNELGQYRLWLYDEKTGKKRCILKREHRLDQIPDLTFPAVAWHPSGHILSFITEEEGGLKLYHYDLETKEITKRNFLYFDKVLDFSYSADGAKLVLSALRNSQTDIYVHTLSSATNEQVTNDLADDLTPRFIDNSKRILFSSNRVNDTIEGNQVEIKPLSPYFRLFVSNYPKPGNKLSQVTNNEDANHTQPYELSGNHYLYLSDGNGIINRYVTEFDSAISYVDTTIHYRFISKSSPITNNPRNILNQDYEKKNNQIGQVFFRDSKNYLYKKDLSVSPLTTPLALTDFRKEMVKDLRRKDSIGITKKEGPLIPQISKKVAPAVIDSAKLFANPNEVDINHYVFEIEKLNMYNNRPNQPIFKPLADSTQKQGKTQPQMRIYQTAFYTNFLVSQVDFTFLNATYQAFNGGAVYYNPGFNMLFKIGTNDLFEDYKITGGFRFSIDFESNEYLLSFENLKKRLDKQLIFHRQSYKNVTDAYDYLKTTTSDAYYVLKYPFSQVFSIRGTASFRHDRVATLATDDKSLGVASIHNIWSGLKGEIIFDNARSLGVNIYSGTRAKIFGEAYKQINRGRSDLFVVGADFRHYLVIHRNLIWANRIAGSSSFGGSKLIYYLGSVDNWMNLSGKVKTFDNTIPVDQKANYAYQTLATNMRGFTQNIRNGNNFAVINSELRWPFIKYFANYPISSSFWSSLQAIGFFDVGSAWTGLTPFSGKNAYDHDIITNGSVTVTLDSNRSPIVYGYGFGLRAQLLGYFMRFDWAWGVENHVVLPRIFYFSLNLDF